MPDADQDYIEPGQQNAEMQRSMKESSGAAGFAGYLFRKRGLIAILVVSGIVLGAVAATLLPTSFKSTAVVYISPVQSFSPLVQFLNVKEDQQGKYLFQLTENFLSEELASPKVFADFVEKNPAMANELGLEPTANSFAKSAKTAKQLPTRPNAKDNSVSYNISFETAGDSSNVVFMSGFLKDVEARVAKRIVDETRRITNLHFDLAKANFNAAVKIRAIEYNNAKNSLLEDIERAKQAGFEDLAYDPKLVNPSEIPLNSAFPRYFDGRKLLEKNLKLLETRYQDQTLMEEYLNLERSRNRLQVFKESIQDTDLDVFGYHITPQTGDFVNLAKRLFVMLAVAAFVAICGLLIMAERYYSRRQN